MTFHPILKGLLFALIPLCYVQLDYLNFSQAGKAAGLAFFLLTPLFFWKKVLISKASQQYLTITLNTCTLIMIINMGFHGFLRHLFGLEQSDIAIMEAIFNTTPSESNEFIQQQLRFIIQHLLIALSFYLIYWIFCIRDTQKQPLIKAKKSSLIGAIIFTLLLVAVHFNPTLRRFNPVIYFPYYYLKWQNTIIQTEKTQETLAKNKHDPKLATLRYIGPEKNTVVFVIGESDTRHNWSLYGYARNTNKKLSTLKNDLLVFNNIRSADGSTIASLQKMLTAATIKHPNLWQTSPDVMLMAKRQGYKVFWLDNQGMPNNGIISIFASHANKTLFTNKSGNLGESSFDEVLQKPYLEALNDPAPKKFIIVHITGEHPSYLFRYPDNFAIFDHVDDVITQKLHNEGRAIWAIAMRNQYDNAVSYVDFNLFNLLTAAQAKTDGNVSWVYIADHGQDVAHHSNFSGHNKKVNEMWDVPLIFWSNTLNTFSNTQREAITNTHYQADIFDSSLLGLLGIEGIFYQPEQDLFKPLHPWSNSLLLKNSN